MNDYRSDVSPVNMSDSDVYYEHLIKFILHYSSSTSTLVLPRALASRASDVSNMVKNAVFTIKTSRGCVV